MPPAPTPSSLGFTAETLNHFLNHFIPSISSLSCEFSVPSQASVSPTPTQTVRTHPFLKFRLSETLSTLYRAAPLITAHCTLHTAQPRKSPGTPITTNTPLHCQACSFSFPFSYYSHSLSCDVSGKNSCEPAAQGQQRLGLHPSSRRYPSLSQVAPADRNHPVCVSVAPWVGGQGPRQRQEFEGAHTAIPGVGTE
jgi:hypothetical protein